MELDMIVSYIFPVGRKFHHGKEIPAFEVTETWITQDVRKERWTQRWLNALIKKTTCSVLFLFVLLRSLFQL